jgi:Flp pilus assembly pilin Flp
MKILKNKRGQQILEYAIIASVIGAAFVAMSTYVFRSVQATQQMIDQESQK